MTMTRRWYHRYEVLCCWNYMGRGHEITQSYHVTEVGAQRRAVDSDRQHFLMYPGSYINKRIRYEVRELYR